MNIKTSDNLLCLFTETKVFGVHFHLERCFEALALMVQQ